MLLDFSSTRGAVELRRFNENEFPSSVQLSGLPQLHRDWRWRGFMSPGDRSDGVKVNVSFSGGMEALISTLCQDRGISEQEAVRALIGEAMEGRRSHLQSPPVTSSHLQSPPPPAAASHPESPPGDSSHLQVTPGDSPRARVEESSTPIPKEEAEKKETQGGSGGARRRKDLPAPPHEIAAPAELWLAYKRDRGESYKSPAALEQLYAKLAGWGPERAMIAVKHSMSSNWAGVFEPNGNGRASPPGKLPTGATQQQLDEARLFDEMEGT